jgi:hypothetical protein
VTHAIADELGEFYLRFDSGDNLQLLIGTRQQNVISHVFARYRHGEIGRTIEE